jgi:uncharacterized protein (DUF952 family)
MLVRWIPPGSRCYTSVPPPDWDQARRSVELRPDSLRTVGFVYLSTPQRVHLPANRLYAGRTDLVLLHLDPTRLGAPQSRAAPPT